MSWTSTAQPCPFPVLADVTVTEASLHTGTACLALMDSATVGEVWEDLLYDGFDHDHGDGGLMLNQGSIGTHFEHDGDFPVRVFRDADGKVVALEVNLDPYGEDLDSLRRPQGWTDEDEAAHEHAHEHGHEHDHGLEYEHGHEPPADGWSAPVTVALASAAAVLGDPAGLPEADDTGGLLDLVWPGEGGTLQASTFADRGIRRILAVVWSA